MNLLTLPYRMLHWMMATRPIRFTRFGTFYILFTIGVGAAAINTGNNLLYLILGMLLGFIVISGFLSDSGLWGLTTEWIPTGSLYAGVKAVFHCHSQKGWFPGIAVTVESHWKGGPSIRSFFPWIPARGRATVGIEITPRRRGYLRLETCRYSTSFPFGLFQKSHRATMEERWIVYPHVERLTREKMESLGRNLSPISAGRLGIGSSPYVLRDYRTGDALRQVHWKISAKRQRLIIKETEEEANQGDLFYLEDWPSGFSAPQMESFISFIASLLFTAHELGRPVGLKTPEAYFPPENSRLQLHQILSFLALVEPGHSRKLSETANLQMRPSQGLNIRSLWSSHAA